MISAENFYPIQVHVQYSVYAYSWESVVFIGMTRGSSMDSICKIMNSFLNRPFNFFVCPYSHKLCNPNLTIRVHFQRANDL